MDVHQAFGTRGRPRQQAPPTPPSLADRNETGSNTVKPLRQRQRSRQWGARRKALETRLLERLFDFVASHPRLRRIALRRLFAAHVKEGVLCYVPFADHTIFVDPRDDKIAPRIMNGHPWQRRQLETAISLLIGAGALKEAGFFVDVGANIGTQTIYALATNAFSGALAIEADRHNFEILRRNVELNGLSGQVRLFHGAASASGGEAQLTRDRQNFGGHSLEPGMGLSPAERVTVRIQRLDDILGSCGLGPSQVAMVKVDVEGHELQVLRGMAGLRVAHVPLLLEFTGRLLGPGRLEELKAWLEPVYQSVVTLDGNVSPCRPSELALADMRHDLLIWSAS
jgi:FkbM family methyltransferase